MPPFYWDAKTGLILTVQHGSTLCMIYCSMYPFKNIFPKKSWDCFLGRTHTGTFHARIVQISTSKGGSNYRFCGYWYWKHNFFNGQLCKGDIGQNFEKVKKNGQGALTSQNKQKQILKLLLASPGAPGVLKEPKGPKDYNHDPFLH